MLRPTDIEELKGDNSRYAMVVGVAQRARQIVDGAKDTGEIIIEKPVSLAIEDFKTGDFKIFAKDQSTDTTDEA